MTEEKVGQAAGGSGQAKISSGSNSVNVLPATTLGGVRKLYATSLGIDAEAVAMNRNTGDILDDSYALKNGDEVEFISRPGSKGG